jgi:hypothetical protein
MQFMLVYETETESGSQTSNSCSMMNGVIHGFTVVMQDLTPGRAGPRHGAPRIQYRRSCVQRKHTH